jgi:hypothetical protein
MMSKPSRTRQRSVSDRNGSEMLLVGDGRLRFRLRFGH